MEQVDKHTSNGFSIEITQEYPEVKFYDRYNPAELLKELGMTNETMVEEIRNKMV
ncbi:hypothetical protein WMO14_01235 [Lachnospira sp. CLA-AA-H255]|uniref:Uncharacterized protein n=1 Tax=[Lactobacillus] rogosae TaxID=706562 RepID=A0ABV1BRX5_9FIRM